MQSLRLHNTSDCKSLRLVHFVFAPRRGIALATLGGPVYAIGGLDDTTCFDIVERYDPESDTWSSVQRMETPRGGVAVCVLKVDERKESNKQSTH